MFVNVSKGKLLGCTPLTSDASWVQVLQLGAPRIYSIYNYHK